MTHVGSFSIHLCVAEPDISLTDHLHLIYMASCKPIAAHDRCSLKGGKVKKKKAIESAAMSVSMPLRWKRSVDGAKMVKFHGIYLCPTTSVGKQCVTAANERQQP